MIVIRRIKEKIRWIRGWEEGSFTVEMSMLFPMIILVIATILLCTFYVNDITCVRAEVNRYAGMDDNWNKTSEEIIEELQENLKDKTLLVNIKEIKADIQKSVTKISVDVGFHIGFWTINRHDVINVTMQSEDNTSFIVKAKVLIDIAENLKGDD